MKTLLIWLLNLLAIILRAIGVLIYRALVWRRGLILTWTEYDELGYDVRVTYTWPNIWHFILYGFDKFYRKETI